MSINRASQNSFMTVFYFKSTQDVMRFAHEHIHKSAWGDLHRRGQEATKHIELWHEVLTVGLKLNRIGVRPQRPDFPISTSFVRTGKTIGIRSGIREFSASTYDLPPKSDSLTRHLAPSN